MTVQTDQEQLMLELINRARLNPEAEAELYGIDLNEDLSAGTLDDTAKQPLAMNTTIIDAALDHSQWMIDNDTFSHSGVDGTDGGDRMADAGYSFTGSYGWGENLARSGTTGTIDLTQAISDHHELLFLSSGHRENTLKGNFLEVGIGQINGDFTTSVNTYDSSMVTVNFAYSGSGNYFITGVGFDDSDGDNFYSVGEGRSSMTITTSSASTTSAPSGGYSLELAGAAYDVTFSGGGLSTSMDVSIDLSSGNVKLDIVDGNTIWSSASLTMGSGTTRVKLLGIADIDATGASTDDNIIGNAGSNTLYGKSGEDKIYGKDGDDTIYGGADDDKIYGQNDSDTLYGGDGDDTVNGGGGKDFLYGSGGEDIIYGEGGNDILWGGADNDEMYGQGSNDTLYGQDDNDTMYGNAGIDKLYGQDGDDTLVGGKEGDTVNGGTDDDHLYGSAGDDILYGEDGIDRLYGGSDNDALYGQNDNDVLFGQDGDDILSGGQGTDTLTGGNDTDTFVFVASWGQDTIADFEDGTEFADVSSAGVTSVDFNVTDTGTGDAIVDFGGTSTITFTGLAGSIDTTDFIF